MDQQTRERLRELLNIVTDDMPVEMRAGDLRDLLEAEERAERYAKALKRIMDAVGGNDKLSGCEEFYRGYNVVIYSHRKIAAEALLAPVAGEKS